MYSTFYSHGKLLLSGEYAVLDGALALAVPTRKGQYLKVSTIPENVLNWESRAANGSIWYKGSFSIDGGSLSGDTQDAVSDTLAQLLSKIFELKPELLSPNTGYKFTTILEFDRNWGLGSSSTLVANLAKWAEIDPYTLLNASFGGSGYDVAAATLDSPFLYQLDGDSRYIQPIELNWPFRDVLHFVHLNRKQDSRQGIHDYRKCEISQGFLDTMSAITSELVTCDSLEQFGKLIEEHERSLSGVLSVPTVKDRLFSDYPLPVKSLGAWGGDFVLVVGSSSNMRYFERKGFETIISFDDMIL